MLLDIHQDIKQVMLRDISYMGGPYHMDLLVQFITRF